MPEHLCKAQTRQYLPLPSVVNDDKGFGRFSIPEESTISRHGHFVENFPRKSEKNYLALPLKQGRKEFVLPDGFFGDWATPKLSLAGLFS